MDLGKLLQSYDRITASFLSEEGYPVSFSTKEFKIDNTNILIARPRGLNASISTGKKACILSHTHNKYIKGIRSVRFQGYLSRVEADSLEFTPQRYYGFKQGGFLNTLRFILNGKKKAKRYLHKRAELLDK